MFQVDACLEIYRLRNGSAASKTLDPFGWFPAVDTQHIGINPTVNGRFMQIIATDGQGYSPMWEHVSLACYRTEKGKTKFSVPTWREMCMVKNLFWNDPEDVVMQLHPRRSEYVSEHDHVLHLWRPAPGSGLTIPEPPSILVGLKKGQSL